MSWDCGGTGGRLKDLFSAGSSTWSFAPTITVPIFTGGQNRANLDLARVEKNVAVAQYEFTIQTAFREVSNALSARGTYIDQRHAQEALVAGDADPIDSRRCASDPASTTTCPPSTPSARSTPLC